MKDFSFERHGSDLINSRLCVITNRVMKNNSIDTLKQLHSCIDLTSLSNADNENSIADFVMGVNTFKENNPNIPNVAGICVYPKFVSITKQVLIVPGVKIVSVAGGFPHAQTFHEVKLKEIELAVKAGANEIDIVINAGEIIDEQENKVLSDIKDMKKACGDAHLKVILETGAYTYDADIYNAAIIAMKGGADFIKTSTGKMEPAATPRAALIMAIAIRDYERATGAKIGLKPAGGIRTSEQALTYYTIVKEILGEERTTNEFFRIGATSLSNALIKDINKGIYK
ncbi:MAG: deoxyribose-phosphate aldolase [Bacteroidales bacterium]|nr:deoxyribose-phosphate aldolase [Bacteroidales bacterium]